MTSVQKGTAAALRPGNKLWAGAAGLLLAAGVCGAAMAQTAQTASVASGQPAQTAPAASGQQAQAAPAKPKADPGDKVICREEDTMGSRLETHRICRTKREWDKIARDEGE